MRTQIRIPTCSVIVLSTIVSLASRAQAQQQPQSIFLEGDMVRGNTGKGQTGPTCVLNSQFKRNENAVFRARVRDITGTPLDDKGIKGIVVELSDGQKLPMRYGGHPPSGSVDYFWSAGWLIPDDYPTGTLRNRSRFRDPRSWWSPAASSIRAPRRRHRKACRLVTRMEP
jgi:hypothetical protein